MRALGFDIDCIERLARRHEQAVTLLAAEAEIGTALRQTNLADPLAVIRCKDLHAVIAFPDPAGADPDIALGIDPQAIRKTGSTVQFHVDQRTRVCELAAVEIVLPDDVLGVWV